jgi:hypothetical protein
MKSFASIIWSAPHDQTLAEEFLASCWGNRPWATLLLVLVLEIELVGDLLEP